MSRQRRSTPRCASAPRAHSGGALAAPCSAARARGHATPGACLRAAARASAACAPRAPC